MKSYCQVPHFLTCSAFALKSKKLKMSGLLEHFLTYGPLKTESLKENLSKVKCLTQRIFKTNHPVKRI